MLWVSFPYTFTPPSIRTVNIYQSIRRERLLKRKLTFKSIE
jgi:hypothetical protein